LGDSQIKTSPPQKIKTMETLISNAIHNIQRAVFHFAHNLGCFISCKISRK
jgi:surfactin synthase thioesterase subunit